jgi:hypothetical protein
VALVPAVVGELHWSNLDQYRQASRDLLAGAYRALGRDALARIVEVHVAYRGLRSISALVPRERGPHARNGPTCLR